MFKRMITVGISILIGFFVLAVYEPQEHSVASASTPVGTIAYVRANDTTGDQIWLIKPDGSNDHWIYSTGVADPYAVYGISSLAWRPDGGELVFASDHELACSWYASDLYAILANGSSYRRVTNAPACAALASYLKGTVRMTLPGVGSFYQVYVQGAPSIKGVSSGGGEVIFENVADLGNIGQPVVVINGMYRYMTNGLVNVQAGGTVNVGVISLTTGGTDTLGAYAPVWRRDGSRIGYAFGCAELYGIADQPPAGNTGQPLFNSSAVTPCRMAWGPTASTANQIVYFTPTGNPGFYRTTEGSSGAGTQFLLTADYDRVFGIQYLPDASGIVFTVTDNWSSSSNIYRYIFASDTLTQLTFYTNEFARDFSLSPDGQTIVFERAPEAWGRPYGGDSDLWMISINGSNARLFKAGGGHPSWSINEGPGPVPSPVPSPVSSKVHLPFVKR